MFCHGPLLPLYKNRSCWTAQQWHLIEPSPHFAMNIKNFGLVYYNITKVHSGSSPSKKINDSITDSIGRIKRVHVSEGEYHLTTCLLGARRMLEDAVHMLDERISITQGSLCLLYMLLFLLTLCVDLHRCCQLLLFILRPATNKLFSFETFGRYSKTNAMVPSFTLITLHPVIVCTFLFFCAAEL